MRLSSIYSNLPAVFPRIDFRPGLNVILGEIRLPENRKKDTHNLGKTALGLLIDYCLLRERDRTDLFLHQHESRFVDFEFFLEIELSDGSFVTVRRIVRAPTKICILRHAVGRADYTNLPFEGWDHADVPLTTAKDLLTESLALAPAMGLRESLSFSLRLQRDYGHVFRLQQWAHVKDRQWKPIVMQFLGLDRTKADEVYARTEEAERCAKRAKQLAQFAQGATELSPRARKKKPDLDRLRGVLREREGQRDALELELEQLQFAPHDRRESEHLTREIERELGELNQRRYARQMAKQRISAALERRLAFDLDKLKLLYEESEIYLSGQLVHDFAKLVQFNREITEERNEYLRRESADLETEIGAMTDQIAALDARRSVILRGLRDEDSVERFRSLRSELSTLQADIETLKTRMEQLRQAELSEREHVEAQDRATHATAALREEILQEPPVYARVKRIFADVVRRVADKGAVLSTELNSKGNPEFRAEILGGAGEHTSEADGNTYRRLLCIAFDLAVLQAREERRFVRWNFHDGVLETLDDRKKYLLVDVLRTAGVQQIVTAIDSDLPDSTLFHPDEIVRLLHDDGENGRLFKMPSW